MLKVSLRNLLVNKLRLFLTVAAVTVGVTFVSGHVRALRHDGEGLRRALHRPDLRHRRRGEVRSRLRGRHRHHRRTGPPARRGDRRRRCARSRASQVARGVGLRLRARSWTRTASRSSPAAPRRSAPASATTAARRRRRLSARAAHRPAPDEMAHRRAHRREGRVTSSATRSTSCSRTAGGPSPWSASSASGRPTACWAPPSPGSTCPPPSRCSAR